MDVRSTPAAVNNNPLNMRPLPNGEQWQGQIGVATYGSTGSFCRFATPAKGVRAAVINMRSIVRLGRRSVSQMINTWAPAGPDQPQGTVNNYLDYVLRQSRLNASYDLGWLLVGNPGERETLALAAIIKAMNEFEAGGSTVSDEDIATGVDDALQIPHGYKRQDDGNVIRENVSQSATVKAADSGIVGTVATVGGGVAVPVVGALAGAPPLTVAIIVAGLLLCGLCGVAYFLYRARVERMKMHENGIA